MGKDWTGNSKSVHSVLTASNHSEVEREENDFYATPPIAVKALISVESFSDKIWEPACGLGHISETFKDSGYEVLSTDLIKRGYEDHVLDFLGCGKYTNLDIVTNPPYKYSLEFLKKAISIVNEGGKVAFFLKVQFLETAKRYEFFKKNPPKVVYCIVNRVVCEMNGDFEKSKGRGGGFILLLVCMGERISRRSNN